MSASEYVLLRFLFRSLIGGGGGGGGNAAVNDCPHNVAMNKAYFSPKRPKQAGHLPLFQPFMGKQFKAPPKMKLGKTKDFRRGYKRFDVPYSTGAPYGAALPPAYEYPCDPSYVNWPCQAPAQQSSIADQVVGSLFLWKPNENPLPKKHSTVNSKN